MAACVALLAPQVNPCVKTPDPPTNVGSVMVTKVAGDTQLLLSITTTSYGPATNPLNTLDTWNVTPLSILYWYGAMPPIAVTTMLPSDPPLQLTLVCVSVKLGVVNGSMVIIFVST